MSNAKTYTVRVNGYSKGNKQSIFENFTVEETTQLKAKKAARRKARSGKFFFTTKATIIALVP